MPRTLDRRGELALLLCREARQATREDLATLGEVLAKAIGVFVVDFDSGAATRTTVRHLISPRAPT